MPQWLAAGNQLLAAIVGGFARKYNVTFLLTNRLNQDCLENLFSTLRFKGGNRDNPDAVEFRLGFRQVMVDAIMLPSTAANCEEDFDKIIVNLQSFQSTENKEKSIPQISLSPSPSPSPSVLP